MSANTKQTSEVSKTSEVYSEPAALKRALRRTQGFALYFARANTPLLREQVLTELRSSLEGRPLVELKLVADEPPYEQIARAAESAPTDAIISVDGLDSLAPSDDPDWLLKQLNWRRAVYRRLGRPLLLWVPEYLLRLLMHHAPDFFDWHSGLFEFAAPQEIRETVMAQAQAVDDLKQPSMTVEEKRERIALLRGLLEEYASDDVASRRARADILRKLGILYRSLGEALRAIEFYQQALEIARQIGDRHGEGAILGSLGIACKDLGDMKRAIEFYQQALEIARQVGDRRAESAWLGHQGLAYWNLSKVQRAINLYEQALEITREIGDRRGEGAWLGNLGIAHARRGEAQRAIEFYQQALDIARQIDDRRSVGVHLRDLGQAYAILGDLQRAIELNEQALDIAHEIGNRRDEGYTRGHLGQAYAALGDAQRAIKFYQQALDIAHEIGDRRGEGLWSWHLALLHEQQGDLVRAAELMSVRVAYEHEIGHPDAEAHAARVERIRARL